MSLAVALAWNCGGKTEEELIHEMMDKVADHIEAGELDDLMSYVADDFQDFQGRSKTEFRRLIDNHFQTYQNIVAHILSIRVSEIQLPEAAIRFDVLLSSGSAKLFRKLVKYAGDIYRVQGKLIKVEEIWKLKFAEWKYINPDELLPDSLKILKKLFPNL